MPLPELKIPAPLVIQQMNMELLLTQLPGVSRDQARTELIRKCLEFGLCGDLAECRLKVLVGEPWPFGGLCVLEFIDKEAQERFGFAKFYVYRGEEVGRRAEAVAFADLESAMSHFRAEQTS